MTYGFYCLRFVDGQIIARPMGRKSRGSAPPRSWAARPLRQYASSNISRPRIKAVQARARRGRAAKSRAIYLMVERTKLRST